MALKAYIEHTFKANVRFEDDSVKEVTFRLPRNTDLYTSEDGNTNLNTLMTFANMAKPFEKPVQVETENGTIINCTTLKELIDLGVVLKLDDVITKWFEKRQEVEAEKEKALKKSKSAGNSTPKDTPETND
jgi:hypothetical protein